MFTKKILGIYFMSLCVVEILAAPRCVGNCRTDSDGYHPIPKVDINDGGPEAHGDFINPPGEQVRTDWWDLGQNELTKVIQTTKNIIEKKAKNTIIFIGDGMGVSTITAGRIHLAQSRQLTGDDAMLSWEKMPHVALSKTYNTDRMTADSAGTATAMLCGVKARLGTVGVNQDVYRANCTSQQGNHVKSMLHHAIEKDLWTGVVTTTRITHATPSASYAHSADRNWEDDQDLPLDTEGRCPDIASQLIDDELNQKIRVIMGGGRRHMLPNNVTDPEYNYYTGYRGDGRNLIEEWQNIKRADLSEDKFKFIYSQQEFDNIDTDNIEYLMGLFESSHMKYEADRSEDEAGEPSIAEMVEKSIQILSRGPEGYFLLVEGGRIDHAHHDTNAYRALNDTVAMSDAVQVAMNMTNEEDTLIVVTADHSHAFVINGYPRSDTPILGYDPVNQEADDDKPLSVLSYANGPGFYFHRTLNGSLDTISPRKNMTLYEQEMSDREYLQDAGVPLFSETHGGEDVAIFARGPMAHLFQGAHEQNYIAHVMMYASCVNMGDQPEPNRAHCNPSAATTQPPASSALGLCVNVLLYFALIGYSVARELLSP